MNCALCTGRRSRRHCPAVAGEICAVCCGESREITLSCPLDCEWLAGAREHERPVPVDAAALPNQDIRIEEGQLSRHQGLLAHLSQTLLSAALSRPGTVDLDAREALDALIKGLRTRQSGIVYSAAPGNALAANLFHALETAAEQYRSAEHRESGMTLTRDADLLALLVFLQRVAIDHNNGRPRSRAFLSVLYLNYPAEPTTATSSDSSLLLP
jgi:hypothetical protein